MCYHAAVEYTVHSMDECIETHKRTWLFESIGGLLRLENWSYFLSIQLEALPTDRDS